MFKGYVNTFFDIKKEVAASGNIGLKEKQRHTKILKDHADFFLYRMFMFERCSMNVTNNNAAVALIFDRDECTPHNASTVYIAAFIRSYARVERYKDAFLPLGEGFEH